MHPYGRPAGEDRKRTRQTPRGAEAQAGITGSCGVGSDAIKSSDSATRSPQSGQQGQKGTEGKINKQKERILVGGRPYRNHRGWQCRKLLRTVAGRTESTVAGHTEATHGVIGNFPGGPIHAVVETPVGGTLSPVGGAPAPVGGAVRASTMNVTPLRLRPLRAVAGHTETTPGDSEPFAAGPICAVLKRSRAGS